MPIELRVPEVGESITEVEIGDWLKSVGDNVRKDEPVVTLESEKATVVLPAPESGTIAKVLKEKGQTAKVGEVIGLLEQDGHASQGESQKKPPEAKDRKGTDGKPQSGKEAEQEQDQDNEKERMAKAPPPTTRPSPPSPRPSSLMPAVERLLAEHQLNPEDIRGTGPGGRILKEDVLRHIQQHEEASESPAADKPTAEDKKPKNKESASPKPEIQTSTIKAKEASSPSTINYQPSPLDEVVPMTRLRRTVAERLVQAQNTAALLTTFNEIDMGEVMALRKQHGEAFQQKYKVKLGFMSFFVKACVDALKQFPVVNAEIRDSNIVYHNHYDIGVAVGGGKGLVVPVLRNAERLSFAEIEIAIGDFAGRAKENKLKMEELQGGTFTISNGGIYGSLLSTPIVNPPQSGILGMHTIQERPVAREGQVVIRPMMYVALTYDHRLVDGREAVSFLKRVKEAIENPTRMLIEI
jgi:2-oxoglutarate dehydrogenase E2 component (dihydrolipoamide succinyltransferase)